MLAGEVDAGDARTIANVCRFHRAMAHVLGTGASGLPGAVDDGGRTGLVLTDGSARRTPTSRRWPTGSPPSGLTTPVGRPHRGRSPPDEGP